MTRMSPCVSRPLPERANSPNRKICPSCSRAFEKLEGDKTIEAARDALVWLSKAEADEAKRAEPLIKAMSSADPSAQVVIIQALAVIRGTDAMEAVRKCQGSGNAEVKKAADKAILLLGTALLRRLGLRRPVQEGRTQVHRAVRRALRARGVQGQGGMEGVRPRRQGQGYPHRSPADQQGDQLLRVPESANQVEDRTGCDPDLRQR